MSFLECRQRHVFPLLRQLLLEPFFVVLVHSHLPVLLNRRCNVFLRLHLLEFLRWALLRSMSFEMHSSPSIHVISPQIPRSSQKLFFLVQIPILVIPIQTELLLRVHAGHLDNPIFMHLRQIFPRSRNKRHHLLQMSHFVHLLTFVEKAF